MVPNSSRSCTLTSLAGDGGSRLENNDCVCNDLTHRQALSRVCDKEPWRRVCTGECTGLQI